MFSTNNKNNFISLSFKFNIFNVGLLCNKFFHIIPLFLDDFDDHTLKKRLHEIFGDFNLVNLYLLNDYYKSSLTQITNTYNRIDDDEFMNYHDSFFNKSLIRNGDATNTWYKNSNPFVPIVNIENGHNMGVTIDKIYKGFISTIKTFRQSFVQLNSMIVDFDKIFLLCYLSFRTREKLIAGSWAFDSNYYIKYISDNIQTQYNSLVLDKYNVYLQSGPVLYEYSRIKYKGIIFSNCMENTLLQFMKILFYDYKFCDYNYDTIRTLVKPELYNDMVNIFENIDFEKSEDFDSKWIDFLLKLTEDFDFANVKQHVEMKASIGNFHIFLKMVFINTLFDEDFITFINNIVKRLEPQYEASIKEIIMNVGDEKLTYNIILDIYAKYNVLISDGHAYFENVENGNFNMMMNLNSKYSSFSEYFDDDTNGFMIYSDILGYLFYKYSEFDDNNGVFVGYYLNDAGVEKLNIKYLSITQFLNRNQMSNQLMECVINNMTLLKKSSLEELIVWKEIMFVKRPIFWRKLLAKGFDKVWNEQIVKNMNVTNPPFTIWEILVDNYELTLENFWLNAINGQGQGFKYWHIPIGSRSVFYLMFKNSRHWTNIWNNYWELYPNKLNICENWNGLVLNFSLWYYATFTIDNVVFWSNVINNNLYKNWIDRINVWNGLLKKVPDVKLWSVVIDKGLCDDWNTIVNVDRGETLWHVAAEYIKDVKFWLKAFDRKYYVWWDMKNSNKNTVWNYLVSNIINVDFWIKIIDEIPEYIKDSWRVTNDPNDVNKTTWRLFVKYQRFNEQILLKLLNKGFCDDWKNNEVWKVIFQRYSRGNIEFWDGVMDRGIYRDWTHNEWEYIYFRLDHSNWMRFLEDEKYIGLDHKYLELLHDAYFNKNDDSEFMKKFDDYFKKNKQIGGVLNYKKKYIKYKNKYMMLKNAKY